MPERPGAAEVAVWGEPMMGDEAAKVRKTHDAGGGAVGGRDA
jgi:hypothetical protein